MGSSGSEGPDQQIDREREKDRQQDRRDETTGRAAVHADAAAAVAPAAEPVPALAHWLGSFPEGSCSKPLSPSTVRFV